MFLACLMSYWKYNKQIPILWFRFARNVFTMINFPAGADAHHESFASSYFRNFNLIDQFTIWPASPVYYLVFFSNKVLCRLVNVYCLSSFQQICASFGTLMNDLITVFVLICFPSFFFGVHFFGRRAMQLHFRRNHDNRNGTRTESWIKFIRAASLSQKYTKI